jgi:ubiquinone/menaquinone biosynthesis C-methylase UbiE
VNRGLNVELELPTAGGDEVLTVAVAEAYERWAPTYDLDANPLLAREERYLLPLFVDLHSKRILDLACGTGRWLETLIAQGARAGVGIDCSSAMLRVAGKKNAITKRLARADCESLPFRTAVFDLAICSFALEHIRDLGSMVRELARVTKTGADVFVSDLHPEAYARGWRAGFRDGSTAVQIEMLPRAAEETVHAFCSNGFESLTRVPLWLGDPEKPIFDRAGKSHAFAEACQLPAVQVCHFRRLDSPIECLGAS